MTRAPLAALCLCLPPAVRADDLLPRYRLTPGRELTYRTEWAYKIGDGRDRSEWTVWVLRTNPDGSARLLFRCVELTTRVRGGQTENAPRTRLLYADLFPDGRVLPNPPTLRGGQATLFPRLPKNAAEGAAGWETRDGVVTATMKPVPGDGFRFATVFVAVTLDGLHLGSSRRTSTFDPARGLVVKAETESAHGYFKGPGTGTLELTGEKTLPPTELAELADDAGRFFAATATYEEAMSAAAKLTPARADEAATKAGDALRAVGGALERPDLKAALADRVKDHDGSARKAVEDAERRAQVVGKPAFEFDATDLDGKPVRLADLKGKVVVLDFWFRACGHCIKAMPQVNQLAGDFAGEPVAVLGINTDEDKADAEFVVKEMGLKYPTLRLGHEQAEKFRVRGFPTLVLIDNKGVVRDLHVGYSPTLREDVGKAVRGLLAEK